MKVMIEKEPQIDYNLITEEAIDELLDSCGCNTIDGWQPVNEHWRYDEGFLDAVKSGWNKLTGKGGEEAQKKQPAKKASAKGKKTSRATTRKTSPKGGTAKKVTTKKAPAKKGAAPKKADAKKNAKGSKVAKKAIEMGKKYVQKKVGGPKGVEAYVKKNQKDLDAKVKNAPTIVQKTWESLKKIVAAGGKKCLEFCKKHWKAIVIVLCIIIAIALLIKYFGGQGTDTVVNSEIAQNSVNEINTGASEISGDSIDADDTNIDADDAEAQREMDELEQAGKEQGIDISDNAMSKEIDGCKIGKMQKLASGDGYQMVLTKDGKYAGEVLVNNSGKMITASSNGKIRNISKMASALFKQLKK